MTTDDFGAKKLNSDDQPEPNPWEVAANASNDKPKYQPPAGYTSNPSAASSPKATDYDLPQSTYRPIYPIPPTPQTPPPPATGYNQPPFGTYNQPYQYPTSFDPQADAYRKAKKRVDDKLSFYNNLRSYVTVVGILWTIWLVIFITSGSLSGFWPIWVTAFWGIGVALHFFNVFGWPQRLEFMNERDRQRMIDEELRRMK